MNNQVMYNGMPVYKIDVPGANGYSFAIATEDDPITAAMQYGLFDDMRDAQYATVEEMGESDFKFWEQYVKVL